jgi:hypothetical protein
LNNNSVYQMTRIVFMHNPKREARFQAFYSRLMDKLMHMQHEHQPDVVEQDTEQQIQWKQWMMAHLHEYIERVSGNEGINLVAAWHGTSEAACYGIGNSGMLSLSLAVCVCVCVCAWCKKSIDSHDCNLTFRISASCTANR